MGSRWRPDFFVAPAESEPVIWSVAWDQSAGPPLAAVPPELMLRFPRTNVQLAPGIVMHRWMSASRSRLAYPVKDICGMEGRYSPLYMYLTFCL